MAKVTQWSIYINFSDYDLFIELLEQHGCDKPMSIGVGPIGTLFHWVVCYPTYEAKMIAKLRFNIIETSAVD